jgi:hypothetical protein
MAESNLVKAFDDADVRTVANDAVDTGSEAVPIVRIKPFDYQHETDANGADANRAPDTAASVLCDEVDGEPDNESYL